MTSSSDTNNSNADEWVQWIEDGISKEYINYKDYEEFQDIHRIGFGEFGKVYRATLGNSNTIVALNPLKIITSL